MKTSTCCVNLPLEPVEVLTNVHLPAGQQPSTCSERCSRVVQVKPYLLEWPNQSTDLNLTENLWQNLTIEIVHSI